MLTIPGSDLYLPAPAPEMRGGRNSRGRGGRGRGEELRSSTMITRSSAEKSEIRVETETQLQLGVPDEIEQDTEQYSVEGVNSSVGVNTHLKDRELKEELASVKAQLKQLQQFVSKQQEEASEISSKAMEDFPPLVIANGTDSPAVAQQASNMVSWRDKVTTPLTPVGMPLKFVPPVIENGTQIVQIESLDVADMINSWEKAVVIYVVGGFVSADIIRGYIRKHWTSVTMPLVHAHEEGYYVLKFNSEHECSEILKGGPYFLNKAPMIVKKWSSNFDFKEEILRVIPVWIRLPSLPLHCWGAESLSRIVSAVGVPIIADECTAKQTKVSYARVLVEVDITQEFVKEIIIRDNTGREFTQKAIPEWRPFYCRKCNKLGHECREGSEANQDQKERVSNAGTKEGRENKMWIPSTLANIIKGVTGVDQLRAKLGDMHGAAGQQDSACTHSKDQGKTECEKEEEGDTGWTQVRYSKAARKNQQPSDKGAEVQPDTAAMRNSVDSTFALLADNGVDQEENGSIERDGNPQIPSKQ